VTRSCSSSLLIKQLEQRVKKPRHTFNHHEYAIEIAEQMRDVQEAFDKGFVTCLILTSTGRKMQADTVPAPKVIKRARIMYVSSIVTLHAQPLLPHHPNSRIIFSFILTCPLLFHLLTPSWSIVQCSLSSGDDLDVSSSDDPEESDSDRQPDAQPAESDPAPGPAPGPAPASDPVPSAPSNTTPTSSPLLPSESHSSPPSLPAASSSHQHSSPPATVPATVLTANPATTPTTVPEPHTPEPVALPVAAAAGPEAMAGIDGPVVAEAPKDPEPARPAVVPEPLDLSEFASIEVPRLLLCQIQTLLALQQRSFTPAHAPTVALDSRPGTRGSGT
jgi:hypothetical protein